MSITQTRSLEALVDDAAKYDRNNYYKRVPLALHPLWQLVPIVGNVIVFVQTCKFIRQVNAHVHVPYRERTETWISIIIMLIIGMVPILGLVLTMYCTNCSDYLAIAVHYMNSSRGGSHNASVTSLVVKKNSQKKDKITNPGNLEQGIYETTVATYSDESLVIVSHADAKPPSATESSPQAAQDTTAAAAKAATTPKTLKRDVKRSKSADSKKTPANVKESDATQRTPSVFARISKLSWMEDIMALSPTDNTRASFSNLALAGSTGQQPHYANIHELATRNSRLDLGLPTSSSLQNLPSYFNTKRGATSNVDLKAMMSTRRMTRSLHIGNDVLDKSEESTVSGDKLLKRPDYSRLESRGSNTDKRSSSLFGLAPSPQQPATATAVAE
ncbi:hypothetical protein IW140_002373 [Coemansia sp. RSA 1813]|nr:hypothetical protein EV178_002035 [Coemansia sp. RSA 1646]KAJ1771845.1 hypothetical protein LPJ74_002019 [Coemansia sp. RSA 1843]KAJ2090810.1 hypothetical protein IW138_002428 [Coemansia sp. RSA 986]KAJ2216056.1 hypothetical protein EV179_001707 [Coemansia sp. RSA 487]KAJ2570473.1 hypothetical protein IW140_002373 [Coemansia sp. RSA 1813]